MNESVHLSIDLARNCFRIHKAALHQIGNPSYILLMIHPDGTRIMVQACEKDDDQALCINARRVESKSSIELYSKTLLDKVVKACKIDGETGSFILTGETIPSIRLAVFYIASIRRIERG